MPEPIRRVNEVRSEWAQARMRWLVRARPNQVVPESDPDWDVCYVQAGRGFGKTRLGAEDTSEYARSHMLCRIALVAPTFADARDTMVEGPAGLLNVVPPSALRGGAIDTAWNRSMGELYFANGAHAKVYSSERPDRLRGPQHDRSWCDEPASFKDAHLGDVVGTTWNNMQLGLRLGTRPRTIVTGTPKRTKLIRDILRREGLLLIRGSTFDNLANLPPDFRRRILSLYEGTSVARQELHGEFIDEVPGALWNTELLDAGRHMKAWDDIKEWVARVTVAIDPAVTTGEDSDETGIVAAGRTDSTWCPKCGPITEPHAFVIADRSGRGLSPQTWAERAIELLHELDGDLLVAEVNNGGDLVEHTLRTVDRHIPYQKVTASRGKRVRAEPVAALFEQGRAHLLGTFSAERDGEECLEDQLCSWTIDSHESPDRLDAMVWAVTELMVGPHKKKVRILA